MLCLADLRHSRCVIRVQNAGLCCTTLCMMLSAQFDTTAWLSLHFQLLNPFQDNVSCCQ